MREITLIGGAADGIVLKPSFLDRMGAQRIPAPPPHPLLTTVDYVPESVGFLWPARLADLLDEELDPIREHHEVSRRELDAFDLDGRYVVPEDAVAYRIRIWCTPMRTWRLEGMLEITSEIMYRYSTAHFMLGPDHPLTEAMEHYTRMYLRESVKLMCPRAHDE